jgi:NAD(P)-dependent dehydrogenase (short-subunit alcohol dehydrogenase family)
MLVPPFALQDQTDFAEVSGDWNPIHLDEGAARRSPFGEVIVHGVHAALRALEMRLAEGAAPLPPLARLHASFPQPTFLGDRLELTAKATEGGEKLTVSTGNAVLTKLTLATDPGLAPGPGVPARNAEAANPRQPLDRRIDEAGPHSGTLALAVPRDRLERLLPGCAARLGGRTLAGLALLSTIVGMEWPGRLSLLSGFDVDFGGGDASLHDIEYRVTLAQEQFRLTKIAVRGPDFSAEVTAFFRPPPPPPLRLDTVAEQVPPGAFRGEVALIVGGSRGLGAVAAKLIAAGGGAAIITYNSDAAAAEALCRELRPSSPASRLLRLDVNDAGSATAVAGLAPPPTLLLYFATPQIFRRRVSDFSHEMLADFRRYYVDGFERVFKAAKESGHLRAALNPSTIALDQPIDQLVEYAAAKGEAEAASRALMEQAGGRISILTPRLPRILTDQTNAVVHKAAADPVAILMPLLQEMVALRARQ